jgi:hypothetical protein
VHLPIAEPVEALVGELECPAVVAMEQHYVLVAPTIVMKHHDEKKGSTTPTQKTRNDYLDWLRGSSGI